VTLYADANFQGTCMAFTANTADLRTTRFGNDTDSSVRVGTLASCSG
jgi:Beta/Gamma crystallin